MQVNKRERRGDSQVSEVQTHNINNKRYDLWLQSISPCTCVSAWRCRSPRDLKWISQHAFVTTVVTLSPYTPPCSPVLLPAHLTTRQANCHMSLTHGLLHVSYCTASNLLQRLSLLFFSSSSSFGLFFKEWTVGTCPLDRRVCELRDVGPEVAVAAVVTVVTASLENLCGASLWGSVRFLSAIPVAQRTFICNPRDRFVDPRKVPTKRHAVCVWVVVVVGMGMGMGWEESEWWQQWHDVMSE